MGITTPHYLIAQRLCQFQPKVADKNESRVVVTAADGTTVPLSLSAQETSDED